MSVRKGSIGGGSNGPRSEGVNKRASPNLNDAEYSAAMAVLSEENMSAACALLLSERDYESNQGDDSDQKKLLELFSKCQEACKVIEKRAPAVPMPMLQQQQQQQRGPTAAARSQAIPLKPKVKTMIPTRRTALASRPSTKKTGPLPPSHAFAPPPARKMQRETSDSSFASTSSVGSGRSAKKARKSPPTLDSQVGGGKAKAPPPEARSFLAALNAQKGKQETGTSKFEEKERPSPKKASPTKSKELPPPIQGSRKQPPRSSRKK